MSAVSTIPTSARPSRPVPGPSRLHEPRPSSPKTKQPISFPRSYHPSDMPEAGGSGRTDPATFIEFRRRRKKSVEQTRTWAEEVDRQRAKAERRAERRAERDRAVHTAHPNQGPLASESVSTHVIDSFVEAMDPSGRYKGPLPTAASVISSLNRQRRWTPESSDEESYAPSQQTSPRKIRQSTPRQPTRLQPASPVRAQSSPITPPSAKSPVMSIDEIIKRHSPAMASAEDAVKEKARKNLGLPISPGHSPDTPSLPSVPVPPLLSSPSDPNHDTPQAAPLEAGPSRQSHLPPTPQSSKAQSRMRRDTHPMQPSSWRPEDSDSDDLGSDLLAGQAYLAKIETVSLASDSLKSRMSTAPSPRPSSRAGDSIRSKHMSLPANMLEQEDHTMARYLRSPKLNRYLSIRRTAPEPPLQVSLADVGAPDGHPLVVFLGIGCVRYLIAMFDDLARALNLRMICIDRWGFGKTGTVPQEKRTPFDWAAVVENVLSQLGIHAFSILAHSAGSPYAAATALRMGDRVKGKVHFLAPWISAEIDGGYKWLKWVPNGVIKGAFAADWKMQTYRLGKPPPLVHKPISHIVETTPRPSLDRTVSRGSRGSTPDKSPKRSGIARRASQILGGMFEPPSSSLPNSLPEMPGSLVDLAPRRWDSFASRAGPTHVIELRSTPTDERDSFDYDLFSQELSRAVARGDGTDKPPVDASLLLALEQASHAECEPGTTDDIMSIILNRPRRPWGFSYTDLRHHVVVWWGDRDERISEKSVRWMERSMGAELRVIPGADHHLMRRTSVLCDVLQDVSDNAAGGYW